MSVRSELIIDLSFLSEITIHVISSVDAVFSDNIVSKLPFKFPRTRSKESLFCKKYRAFVERAENVPWVMGYVLESESIFTFAVPPVSFTWPL